MHFSWEQFLWILQHSNSWMMFHFNLHHITLILIGYLSNISCSPLLFGLLSSQVSGNGITFSHVELPSYTRNPFKSIYMHTYGLNVWDSILMFVLWKLTAHALIRDHIMQIDVKSICSHILMRAIIRKMTPLLCHNILPTYKQM